MVDRQIRVKVLANNLFMAKINKTIKITKAQLIRVEERILYEFYTNSLFLYEFKNIDKSNKYSYF